MCCGPFGCARRHSVSTSASILAGRSQAHSWANSWRELRQRSSSLQHWVPQRILPLSLPLQYLRSVFFSSSNPFTCITHSFFPPWGKDELAPLPAIVMFLPSIRISWAPGWQSSEEVTEMCRRAPYPALSSGWIKAQDGRARAEEVTCQGYKIVGIDSLGGSEFSSKGVVQAKADVPLWVNVEGLLLLGISLEQGCWLIHLLIQQIFTEHLLLG